MKSLLLLSIAVVGITLGGCRAVVVGVDTPRAAVGYSSVSYYQGRPYYYSGRTRHWGYPPGYRHSGHRYDHYDRGHSHRRTVIRY